MSEKRFSKKHEWVSIEGDTATVGITKHATEMLGDIVFVEVPEQGKSVCLLYTSPSPRDLSTSRMPSSA